MQNFLIFFDQIKNALSPSRDKAKKTLRYHSRCRHLCAATPSHHPWVRVGNGPPPSVPTLGCSAGTSGVMRISRPPPFRTCQRLSLRRGGDTDCPLHRFCLISVVSYPLFFRLSMGKISRAHKTHQACHAHHRVEHAEHRQHDGDEPVECAGLVLVIVAADIEDGGAGDTQQ